MSAKFGMNLALQFAIPNKLLTSEALFGTGTSSKSAIFAGSGFTPSSENIIPKNESFGRKNSHFSLLTVSFLAFSLGRHSFNDLSRSALVLPKMSIPSTKFLTLSMPFSASCSLC